MDCNKHDLMEKVLILTKSLIADLNSCQGLEISLSELNESLLNPSIKISIESSNFIVLAGFWSSSTGEVSAYDVQMDRVLFDTNFVIEHISDVQLYLDKIKDLFLHRCSKDA